MKPGLFSLLKIAAKKSQPQHNDFLDEHFSISPKWKDFRTKLKSPTFIEAVRQDTRANEKLIRYAENNGRHAQAKNVPVFKVPSQSSSIAYTVKYHPSIDEYSCNCGDWIHSRSHQENKENKNCKHIKLIKEREDNKLKKMATKNAAIYLMNFFS